MTKEALILMNKILNILGKMEYKDYLPEFYFSKVNKDFITHYIYETILNDFSNEELKQLKTKIFNCKDNYDMAGIVGSRINLPNITK